MVQQKFNITSEYEKVDGLIFSVKEFLAKEKVESHILSGVDICLTEALNNIIKHAYKGEQNNPIEVIVSKDSNQLELLLIDCGRPRDNFVIKDLEFDPNDIENLPEGGMGLYLIKQLMDEINYYSINGKNYFTLRKILI
ncbi:MAG: ATP-binding protein [Melioribacteraceae bacterium]|nr:ATP-binding protein [Melioribacteraceae bacterium]